jgi:hypothetical protein
VRLSGRQGDTHLLPLVDDAGLLYEDVAEGRVGGVAHCAALCTRLLLRTKSEHQRGPRCGFCGERLLGLLARRGSLYPREAICAPLLRFRWAPARQPAGC